uniref:(northern house mosquito) hypothetical protein n=1 Tax=Culex pipiens TaxID=7175 RepID=A0A8D8IW43_CULPI
MTAFNWLLSPHLLAQAKKRQRKRKRCVVFAPGYLSVELGIRSCQFRVYQPTVASAIMTGAVSRVAKMLPSFRDYQQGHFLSIPSFVFFNHTLSTLSLLFSQKTL